MTRPWIVRPCAVALGLALAAACGGRDVGYIDSFSDTGDTAGATAVGGNGGDETVGSGSGGASGRGGTASGGTGRGGGVSSGGSGAIGGSGGVPHEPPPCDSFTFNCGQETGHLTKVNMLIVLDKSGSMTQQPAGYTAPLWNSVRLALDGVLNQVKGLTSFGLVLFPDMDVPFNCALDTCCLAQAGNQADIPIADGVLTLPQILDTLDVTAPGGGTPIARALQRAFEYYTTGSGATLDGDKFVLLVTDGGPNCNSTLTCDAATCTVNIDGRCQATPGTNCCAGLPDACLDDGAVIDQITALRAAGIDTFVVGMPGSENYAGYMDQFAVAGGRPNAGGATQYYAAGAAAGVEGLQNVLETIATQLVPSCDVQLSRVPPDPTNVNVAIDCEVIPRATYGDDGTLVSGDWDLDATVTPPIVRLVGDTCAFVRQMGVERIDAVYGCPGFF